jgi:protein-S-isoprenylcysteine O-methyltransferase Ste14
LLALLQTDIWVFSGLQQALDSQPRQEGFRADGMYRVVRHPVYSLGLVLLWLLPVMSANTLALILASTLYIFAGAALEERKLLAQFPEYEDYRRKVPMFIPGLWKKTDTY